MRDGNNNITAENVIKAALYAGVEGALNHCRPDRKAKKDDQPHRLRFGCREYHGSCAGELQETVSGGESGAGFGRNVWRMPRRSCEVQRSALGEEGYRLVGNLHVPF